MYTEHDYNMASLIIIAQSYVYIGHPHIATYNHAYIASYIHTWIQELKIDTVVIWLKLPSNKINAFENAEQQPTK